MWLLQEICYDIYTHAIKTYCSMAGDQLGLSCQNTVRKQGRMHEVILPDCGGLLPRLCDYSIDCHISLRVGVAAPA